MSDKIQVVIRMRPFLQRETNNEAPLWQCRDKSIEQVDSKGHCVAAYTFDQVFDACDTTEDLYRDTVSPIVEAAMEGFHGTVFAYGQTSSGKTFTMGGSKLQPGIIPCAIEAAFEKIQQTPDREFLMRASYLEIYKEKLSDLLSTEEKTLKITQDQHNQLTVTNLTERIVTSTDEALELLKEGNARKRMGETTQNERSSRSHCIFKMIIESREIIFDRRRSTEQAVMVSHLNFVDLAGSEKAGENSGERLKEGCAINKSLSCLSNVISKLSEGTGDYINYRDSNLTRYLQNALGGNSKTAIICTVTPAFLEQTHSTLRFASRAKAIENKPLVNEVLSEAALLKKYKKEIDRLRKQLNEQELVAPQTSPDTDLRQQLEQQEKLQKKQEAEIERLKKFFCVSTLPNPESCPAPYKKMRRETWCPGPGRRQLPQMFSQKSNGEDLNRSISDRVRSRGFDFQMEEVFDGSIPTESSLRMEASCQTDPRPVQEDKTLCMLTESPLRMEASCQTDLQPAQENSTLCLPTETTLGVEASCQTDLQPVQEDTTLCLPTETSLGVEACGHDTTSCRHLQEEKVDSNAQELQNQLEQSMNICDNMISERNVLQIKLQESREEATNMADKIVTLQNQLIQVTSQLEKKEAEFVELEEFTRLEKECQTPKPKKRRMVSDDSLNDVQKLQDEIINQQKNASDAEAVTMETRKALAESRNHSTDLEIELAETKKQLDQLSKEKVDFDCLLEHEKIKNESRQKQLRNELQAAYKDIQQLSRDPLLTQLEEISAKVETLDVSSLASEMEMLKEQLAEARLATQCAEEESQSKVTECSKLTAQVTDLKTNVAELAADLSDSQDECFRLSEELQDVKTSLQQNCDSLQQELEDVKQTQRDTITKPALSIDQTSQTSNESCGTIQSETELILKGTEKLDSDRTQQQGISNNPIAVITPLNRLSDLSCDDSAETFERQPPDLENLHETVRAEQLFSETAFSAEEISGSVNSIDMISKTEYENALKKIIELEEELKRAQQTIASRRRTVRFKENCEEILGPCIREEDRRESSVTYTVYPCSGETDSQPSAAPNDSYLHSVSLNPLKMNSSNDYAKLEQLELDLEKTRWELQLRMNRISVLETENEELMSINHEKPKNVERSVDEEQSILQSNNMSGALEFKIQPVNMEYAGLQQSQILDLQCELNGTKLELQECKRKLEQTLSQIQDQREELSNLRQELLKESDSKKLANEIMHEKPLLDLMEGTAQDQNVELQVLSNALDQIKEDSVESQFKLDNALTNEISDKDTDMEIRILKDTTRAQCEELRALSEALKVKEQELIGSRSDIDVALSENDVLHQTKDSETCSLKNTVKNQSEELESISQKLQLKEQEVNEGQSQIDSLKCELDAAVSETCSLKDTVKNQSEELESISQKLQLKEQEVNEGESQIDSLKFELDAAVSENVKTKDSEICSLKVTVKNESEELESISQKLQLKEQEVNEGQSQIDSLKCELDAAVSETCSLKDTVKNQSEELESISQKLQLKEQEVNEGESQIDSLKFELDAAVSENVKTKDSEICSLKVTVKNESEELESISQKLQLKEQEVNEGQSQIDSLKCELDAAVSETCSLKDTVKNRSEELESISQKLHLKEQEVNEGESQIDSLKCELDAAVSETCSLKDTVKNRSEELESISQKLHLKEQEVNEGESQIDSLKCELDAAVSETCSLKDTVKNRSEELESISQKLHLKEQEVNEGESQIDSLKCELDAAVSETCSLKDTVKNRSEELESISQKLQLKEQEVNEGQSPIDSLKCELDAAVSENVKTKDSEICSLKVTVKNESEELESISQKLQLKEQEVNEGQSQIDSLKCELESLKFELDAALSENVKTKDSEICSLKVTVKNRIEELESTSQKLLKEQEVNEGQSQIESLKFELDATVSENVKTKDSEICSLKDTVKNQGEELEIISQKLQLKEQEVNEGESQIESIKCELDAAVSETCSLKDTVKNRSEELESISQKLQLKEQEVNEGQSQIDSLKCELDAAVSETCSLKDTLKNRSEELESISQKLHLKEQEVNEGQSQIDSLKCELDATVSENVKTKDSEICSLKDTVKNQSEELESISQKLHLKEQKVNEGQSQIDSLKCELDAAVSETCSLKDTVKNRSEELESISQKLHLKEQEVNEGQSQIESLKCELDAAVSETCSLKDTVKNRSEELESISQKLQLKEQEVNEGESQIESLKCELDAVSETCSLKDTVKNRSEELESISQKLQLKEQEVNEGQSQIESLKCELDAAVSETCSLKDIVKNRSEELESISQKLQLKEQEVNEGQSQIDSLKCELDAAVSENVKTKDSEICSLKVTVKNESEELESISQKLQLKEQEVNEGQSQIDSLKCELESLKFELDAALSENVKTKDSEICSLKVTVKNRIEELESTSQKLLKEQEVNEGQSQIESLKFELDATVSENVKTKDSEICSLKDTVKNQGEELEIISQKLQLKEQEVNEGESQIESIKCELDAAVSETCSLKDTVKNRSEELESISQKLQLKEQEVNEGQSQIDSLKCELDAAVSETCSLKDTLKNRSEELESISQKLHLKEQEVNEGQSQIDSLKCELDATVSENVKTKDSEICSLKDTVKNQSEELESISQKLHLKEQKVNEGQSQIDSLKCELDAAVSETCSLKDTVKNRSEELESISQKLHLKEQEVNEGQSQIESLKCELDAAVSETCSLKDTVKNRSEELESISQKLQLKEQEVNEGESQIESLKCELDAVSETCSLKDTVKNRSEELESISQKLQLKEQEVNEGQSQIESLKCELDAAVSETCSLKDIVKNRSEELESISQKLQLKEQEVNEGQSQIDSLKCELDATVSENVKTKDSEICSLKDTVKNQSEELEIISQKLQLKEQEVNEGQSQIDSLKCELDAAVSETCSLKDTVKNRSEELESISQKLQLKEQEVNDGQSQIDSLKCELDATVSENVKTKDSEICSLKDTVKNQSEELESISQKLQLKEQEVNEGQSQIDSLKCELDAAVSETCSLKDTVKNRSEELESISQKLQLKEQEVNEGESQIESLKCELDAAVSETCSLKDTVKNQSEELEIISQKLQLKEQEVNEGQSQIDSLKCELDAAVSETCSLKDTVKNRSEELESISQKLQLKEQEINEGESQIESLKCELDAAVSETCSLKDTVKNRSEELESISQKLQLNEQELVGIKSEKFIKCEQVTILKTKVESMETELQQKGTEIEHLEIKLKSVTGDCSSQQSAFTTLQEKYSFAMGELETFKLLLKEVTLQEDRGREAEKEAVKYQMKCNQLSETCTTLESQVSELKTKVASVETEKRKAKEDCRLAEFRLESSTADNSILPLKELITDMQAQINKHLGERDSLQNKLDTMKKELEYSKEELTVKTEEKNTAQSQLSVLTSVLDDLTQSKKLLQLELNKAQEKNPKPTSPTEVCNDLNESFSVQLTAPLVESNRNAISWKIERMRLYKECRDLKEKIKNLTTINTYRAELQESAEKTTEEHKLKIEDLEVKLIQLSKKTSQSLTSEGPVPTKEELDEKNCLIQEQDRKINEQDLKIQEQNQKIQELDQKIQEQDLKIHEQDQKIQELDQKIQEQNQKIQEQNQKIQEQNQKIQELDQKIQEQDLKINEQDQKIQELDQKIQELEHDVKRTESRVRSMKQELKQKEMEVIAHSEERKRIKVELMELSEKSSQHVTLGPVTNNEQEDKNSVIEKLEHKVKQMERQVRSMKQELKQKEMEVIAHSDERKRLKVELMELSEKSSQHLTLEGPVLANNEQEDKNSVIEKLEHKVKQLERQVRTTKQELRQKGTEVEVQKEDRKRLQEENTSKDKLIKELQDKASSEPAIQVEDISDVKKELAQKKLCVVGLQSDLQVLQNESEKRVASLTETVEEKNHQIKIFKQEIRKLTEQVSANDTFHYLQPSASHCTSPKSQPAPASSAGGEHMDDDLNAGRSGIVNTLSVYVLQAENSRLEKENIKLKRKVDGYENQIKRKKLRSTSQVEEPTRTDNLSRAEKVVPDLNTVAVVSDLTNIELSKATTVSPVEVEDVVAGVSNQETGDEQPETENSENISSVSNQERILNTNQTKKLTQETGDEQPVTENPENAENVEDDDLSNLGDWIRQRNTIPQASMDILCPDSSSSRGARSARARAREQAKAKEQCEHQ